MLRVTVRVRPGAGVTKVGGRYDAGETPALVVRVREPAVDGRATQAVLRAVAEAFGVRKSAVSVVTGSKARTKVLQIEGDYDTLSGVLRRLQDI